MHQLSLWKSQTIALFQRVSVVISVPGCICCRVFYIIRLVLCVWLHVSVLTPFFNRAIPITTVLTANLLFFVPDTTSSSSYILWESLESCSPFTLLCHSYADLECTPWGFLTSITCPSTTTTASSSSCCPTSHVRVILCSPIKQE